MAKKPKILKTRAVGHPSSTVARVHNAANRVEYMKMGVDYRRRAHTENVVAGRMRTAGQTKAPRVRGSR